MSVGLEKCLMILKDRIKKTLWFQKQYPIFRSEYLRPEERLHQIRYVSGGTYQLGPTKK